MTGLRDTREGVDLGWMIEHLSSLFYIDSTASGVLWVYCLQHFRFRINKYVDSSYKN